MAEKLEPCPFCGARTAYTAPPALGKGRWVVQCDDCRAEGPQSSDNSDAGEAEAIAAWNRRAPTTNALPEGEADLEQRLRWLGVPLLSGSLPDAITLSKMTLDAADAIAPLVEEVEKAKADCQALCNALMDAVAMIGHCIDMSATVLIGGKVLKAEDVWQSGFDLLFPPAPLPAKEGE